MSRSRRFLAFNIFDNLRKPEITEHCSFRSEFVPYKTPCCCDNKYIPRNIWACFRHEKCANNTESGRVPLDPQWENQNGRSSYLQNKPVDNWSSSFFLQLCSLSIQAHEQHNLGRLIFVPLWCIFMGDKTSFLWIFKHVMFYVVWYVYLQ